MWQWVAAVCVLVGLLALWSAHVHDRYAAQRRAGLRDAEVPGREFRR
jgi:hypothetical protein